METFIIYFLKANLVLSLLFLVFWLFLKGEKFFRLNRAILLGIIVSSLLLPVAPSPQNFGVSTNTLYQTHYTDFIGFDNRVNVPENNIKTDQKDTTLQVATTGTISAKQISLTSFAFFVYLIICTGLLIRFLAQLIRLFNILKNSEKRVEGGIIFCNSKADLTPFSFFNYLVINESKYNKSQTDQIVEHEKVHIKQWHTLDILFAEAFSLFFWANPLVNLLKQYVKLNLEYIADQEVINTGVDTKSYQLNILNACLNPASVPLTNLFTSSKTKLRIKMMNTRKSPLYNMYKYAFVLPLVVLMYVVVNTANAKNESDVSLTTPDGLRAYESLFQFKPWKDSYLTMKAKTVVNTENAEKESSIPKKASDFKAYEGYYKFQFKPGVDSYIHIRSQNNHLLLREQWSGKEVIFEQQSELEFLNKAENFSLKFTKTKEGAITQVLAYNKDLWNKDNEYRPKIKTAGKLTSDQLKTFEGYYQLRGNKEMVAKMVTSGNDLIVKTLWNGIESTYSPESELVFFLRSGDNGITIKFEKDANGNITSGTDFMGRTWYKNDNYTPRKEIQMTAKQLQLYEGIYTFEFKPGKRETITIKALDGTLELKEAWSGKEITFFPESDLDFFSKQRPFPLKFTKDANGNVTHLLAFEKDLWTKAK
jgi:hypothetical protein